MNRIYFIVLLFFLVAAFTVKKSTSTQNDPAVFKLMEVASLWDLLKDSYEPDRDRDGTWLTVGLRSKYAMAKKYAALNMLETAFGKKVFVSGPHGNDMNYESKTSFGSYNPDFIADFRSVWGAAIANPTFKEVLKNVYYKHFQGIADTYFDAYHFLNQNPKFLKALEGQYQAEMNSNEGVDSYEFNEYFRNFSALEEQKNLDFYEAITAPSFWLRRSLDGTASQLYDLQVMMMQTFELDFTARVTQTEKDEYEALIQETLLTFYTEIPNKRYPAITSKAETTSKNTNVFIDERDQQSYEWVVLKDGNKWMAKNLSFSFAGNSNEDCSYCQTYGRLYRWDMAQKACPKGWRLPTDTEWDNLIKAYGTKYEAFDALAKGGTSGFSAVMGGQIGDFGGFDYLDSEGYYWSSTEKNSSEAWQYNFISYDGAKINKYEAPKEGAYSCRCIQE